MICSPICANVVVVSRGSDRFIQAVVRACCRTVYDGSVRNLCHVQPADNILFPRCVSHTSSSVTGRHVLCMLHVGRVHASSALNSWRTVLGSRKMTFLAQLSASGETIDQRTGLGHPRGFQFQVALGLVGILACSLTWLRFPLVFLSSRRGMAWVPLGMWTGDKSMGPSAPGSVQPARHKSRSGGSKSSTEDQDSEEEELDDDDYEAPLNFKKMKIYLKSLRADSVISSALDISRNRVDETFFASRLRLNGEKLLKKSKLMSEGDYVEVIMDRTTDEDKLLVKRVKVMAISADRTNKDKLAVTVKVWKSAFPVQDTSKSQWK